MKINNLRKWVLAAMAGGLGLAAGCVVEPSGRVAFEPVVVAPPPPGGSRADSTGRAGFGA